MTRKEAEKYIKSEMCNNCGIYLGGGKCSDNCNVIEIIQALSQDEYIRGYDKGFDDGIEAGIKATVEPCDGVVSRDAVNILVDELARAISDERCHIPQRGRDAGHIMHDILDLPPVNPQPKTGYWINKDFRKEEYVVAGKCSVCGQVRVIDEFCSHCGAKMIGVKE